MRIASAKAGPVARAPAAVQTAGAARAVKTDVGAEAWMGRGDDMAGTVRIGRGEAALRDAAPVSRMDGAARRPNPPRVPGSSP